MDGGVQAMAAFGAQSDWRGEEDAGDLRELCLDSYPSAHLQLLAESQSHLRFFPPPTATRVRHVEEADTAEITRAQAAILRAGGIPFPRKLEAVSPQRRRQTRPDQSEPWLPTNIGGTLHSTVSHRGRRVSQNRQASAPPHLSANTPQYAQAMIDASVYSHSFCGTPRSDSHSQDLFTPTSPWNWHEPREVLQDGSEAYENLWVKRSLLSHAWAIWGYKLVAKVGGQYFSLWAGEVSEYEIDCPMENEALQKRRGGLYICDSPTSAARQYIETSFAGEALNVALLRCACTGPFVDYGGGKAACSGILPCSEVPLPDDSLPFPARGLWDRLYTTGTASIPTAGAYQSKDGRLQTMPGWDIVGYTLVASMGNAPSSNQYFSLWAVETFRYNIGQSIGDTALIDPQPDHLWVVRSPEDAPRVRIAISEKLKPSGIGSAPRMLLRCSCEGPFVELPDGRVACSKLTPLDEVELPSNHFGNAWQDAEFVPSIPQQPRPPRTPKFRTSSNVRRAVRSAQKRPSSAPFTGRRLGP